MKTVESFELNHEKVLAPFVRKCSVLKGPKGDCVTKFDLRFTQPNVSEMESDAIHTLEHLLAVYIRDFDLPVIDLSPMGCRTGFYMTLWGEAEEKTIANVLIEALKKVVQTREVPAANAVQCGNYKLHNLELAKQYASLVIKKGFNENYILP